jgi:hypothetical protein
MPSKAACRQAAPLESPSAAAWAEVVPAELLDEFFLAVDDPNATFNVRLGGETSPTLAHRLDKNGWSSSSLDRMMCRLSTEGGFARRDDTSRLKWFALLLVHREYRPYALCSPIRQLDATVGLPSTKTRVTGSASPGLSSAGPRYASQ